MNYFLWSNTAYNLKFFKKIGLSPSIKMMKNAFNFILKALFVLKIFNFLSWLFGHVDKTAWLERHSLKSGSETWDPGPGTLGLCDPRPGTRFPRPCGLRPGTLESCDLELWDARVRNLGLGILEWDPGTLRLATTDCINFICEANFDNKKLGHVCRKRWDLTFRDIFFSFLCKK